jgi:hypothetical protein
MTKMRELLRAWSGASTATVDFVAHALLLMHHDQLLVGLAEAYGLLISQPTICGVDIMLRMGL